MQHPQRLLFVPLLALFFLSCNNPGAGPESKTANGGKTGANTAADTTAFSVPRDTLVGFKGMDRCGYTRSASGEHEFTYRHYSIKTNDLKDEPGQSISIMNLDTKSGFSIPSGLNGFFAGISQDVLFVDIGTGPDNREMVLFSLKTMKPVLKSRYVGDPEVLDNGKMWYMKPADEKTITKMPDCPDRGEWEKQGLRVGYGQVCVYSLTANTELRKMEWRCVPLQ